MVRQLLMQAINIGSGIFLARLLSPSAFGLYAVVTFFLAFLVAFGDAGLAASLIRSKDEPSPRDYASVFTIQMLFVGIAGSVFWCLAPWIAEAYSVESSDAWVFRLMALSLVITSLMVMPQVRLERELRFDKIAAVEVVQAIVFNTIVVGMAWNNYGPISFGVAMLCRAVVGAVLLNLISTANVRLIWDWSTVKRHMHFGLPFQGVKIICFIKDSITPIFIGLMINAQAVGYLNWAGLLANYPVLGLFVLQRVYMPAFAKLQSDPAALTALVERVVWATNALVAPLAVLTLVLCDEITRYVFGEKWLAALYLLPFMWTANLFLPTVTPAMGLMDALGKSKTNFKATLLWMVLTWGLGLPMLYLWGLEGFVSAVVVVNVSHIFLLRSAQKTLPFKIMSNLWGVWAIAGLMGIAMFFVDQIAPPQNLLGLLGYLAIGMLIYMIAAFKAYPARSMAWIQTVRHR